MEDTSPQSNKEIFTSEELIIQQISQTKEKHFAHNVSYSGSLKIHQINNTGDMQFSCIQCNKDFSELGDIKRHMLSHSGGKQLVCTQCDKGFSLLGHLKRHQLIHTRRKLFACTNCSKVFFSYR